MCDLENHQKLIPHEKNATNIGHRNRARYQSTPFNAIESENDPFNH